MTNSEQLTLLILGLSFWAVVPFAPGEPWMGGWLWWFIAYLGGAA